MTDKATHRAQVIEALVVLARTAPMNVLKAIACFDNQAMAEGEVNTLPRSKSCGPVTRAVCTACPTIRGIRQNLFGSRHMVSMASPRSCPPDAM